MCGESRRLLWDFSSEAGTKSGGSPVLLRTMAVALDFGAMGGRLSSTEVLDGNGA